MERGGAAPPSATAGSRGVRLPWAERAEASRSQAEGAEVPSLATLEGSFARLSPEEARAAYATSGAAAQALLDRSGPMVIFNLLTNLGNGMKFEDAFERAALMRYSDFKQTWR
jgi:hypothetical protein